MEYYYIIVLNFILIVMCLLCCKRFINEPNRFDNLNQYRQSFISNRSSFNTDQETNYYEIHPTIVAVPMPSALLIENINNEDPL